MTDPNPPDQIPAVVADTRFTYGLIYDVVKVLTTYGYVMDEDLDSAAMAKTVLALAEVVKVFEGRDEREAHAELDAQFAAGAQADADAPHSHKTVADYLAAHPNSRPADETMAVLINGAHAETSRWQAEDERIDREYAEMEEHPGPELAKAEAAYRGETPPKYAMLAPDAPQVYAEMLKAVEQVDELPDHRPDLAEMPHTITIERLDARTARDVNMSERAGLLVLVERHNGRAGKIMRITWQDMAETAAKNTAHVYGATYVPAGGE